MTTAEHENTAGNFGTKFEPVEFRDVSTYLGPFSGRGSGWVRDHLLRVEPVEVRTTAAGTTVTVACAHPATGRYRIVLEDVSITEQSEPARIPTSDDARHLERAVWSVCDRHGHYYGTIRPSSGRGVDGTRWVWPNQPDRETELVAVTDMVAATPGAVVRSERTNIVGVVELIWNVGDLRVERAVPDPSSPGACVGCGSARFVFSCLASFPVIADGENSLQLDPVVTSPEQFFEQTKLHTTFTSVRCAECDLEKTTGYATAFEGDLAGQCWGAAGLRKQPPRPASSLLGAS